SPAPRRCRANRAAHDRPRSRGDRLGSPFHTTWRAYGPPPAGALSPFRARPKAPARAHVVRGRGTLVRRVAAPPSASTADLAECRGPEETQPLRVSSRPSSETPRPRRPLHAHVRWGRATSTERGTRGAPLV